MDFACHAKMTCSVSVRVTKFSMATVHSCVPCNIQFAVLAEKDGMSFHSTGINKKQGWPESGLFYKRRSGNGHEVVDIFT
jgi:hypothetical protein